MPRVGFAASLLVALAAAAPAGAQVSTPSETPSASQTPAPTDAPSVPQVVSPRDAIGPLPPPSLDSVEPAAGPDDGFVRDRGPAVPDYRQDSSAGGDASGLTRRGGAAPSALDSGEMRSPSQPVGRFGAGYR